MSGGKQHSSSQGQTQSQATSTQQLDPQIKAALLGNYANFSNAVPAYSPYSGTTVAAFTPAQEQSFGLVQNIADNQTGLAPLNSAIGTTQNIAGFTPQQVGAQTAMAGLIDPNSVSNVTAQSIPTMNLASYEDPYQSQVINGDTAAAINALNLENNQTQSDLTKAGAWRGNAAAVQEGINAGQTNTGLAQEIGSLLNTDYTTALNTATADANRALQAGQGNQATQLAEATTNAGNTTTANLANANNALQASLANQQAGISGANLQLTAGQNLASMGEQQLTDAATRASLLNQSGSQQQSQNAAQLQWLYENNYLNPQQYAMALQQLKNQTLGLAGNPVLGSSQSTSSGTNSSNSSGFNFGIAKA